MSSKKQRFASYVKAGEDYIKHQMTNHTQEEIDTFRVKWIVMYDDEIEKYASYLERCLKAD